MEPITWGALAAVVTFAIAVFSAVWRGFRKHDQDTEVKIRTAVADERQSIDANLTIKLMQCEQKFEMAAHERTMLAVRLDALELAAVKQQDLAELKAAIKMLEERVADLRVLMEKISSKLG